MSLFDRATKANKKFQEEFTQTYKQMAAKVQLSTFKDAALSNMTMDIFKQNKKAA